MVGHVLVPRIFDGEHRFELVEAGEGRTRFIHSEQFRGILVGPMLRWIGEATEEGFRSMDERRSRESALHC